MEVPGNQTTMMTPALIPPNDPPIKQIKRVDQLRFGPPPKLDDPLDHIWVKQTQPLRKKKITNSQRKIRSNPGTSVVLQLPPPKLERKLEILDKRVPPTEDRPSKPIGLKKTIIQVDPIIQPRPYLTRPSETPPLRKVGPPFQFPKAPPDPPKHPRMRKPVTTVPPEVSNTFSPKPTTGLIKPRRGTPPIPDRWSTRMGGVMADFRHKPPPFSFGGSP